MSVLCVLRSMENVNLRGRWRSSSATVSTPPTSTQYRQISTDRIDEEYSEGNPHPYDDRREKRSGGERKPSDRGSEKTTRGGRSRSRRSSRSSGGQEVDARVRARSRSIVKDARSFLDEIDGSSRTDAGESVASEDSHNDSVAASSAASGRTMGESSQTAEAGSGDASRRGHGGVGGARVRNQFKDQQALRELRELHRRQRSAEDASALSEADLLETSAKALRLLESLQETNAQNEDTIALLQDELADLTNERNAFRNNSERMMEITTRQKSQLEKELKKERKGFADASHRHKKEREEWERAADELRESLRSAERRADRYEDFGASLTSLREGRGEASGGEAEAGLLASALGIDVEAPLPAGASQSERDLRFAVSKMSEMEDDLRSRLRRLREEREATSARAEEWRERHDRLDTRHRTLLDERDEEAAVVATLENKLDGCRLVIESLRTGPGAEKFSESLSNVNDELVAKIADLADENGRLLARCRRAERELEDGSSSSARESSTSLDPSSKDATASSSSSSGGGRDPSSVDTSKSLEARVSDLTRDLEAGRAEHEKALARIGALRAENRDLRAAFEDHDERSRRTRRRVRDLRASLAGAASGDVSSAREGGGDDRGEEEEGGDRPARSIVAMEHREALAAIRELRDEDEGLCASIDEAVEMAGAVGEELSRLLARAAASTSEGDEDAAAAASLREELDRERSASEDLAARLEALRDENKSLTAELEAAQGLVLNSVRDEIQQEQLSKEGWDRERRELTSAAAALREENGKLRESLGEMNGLVASAEECVDRLGEENARLKDGRKYYEERERELTTEREANQYLREEIRSVSAEREEAYGTCKVLQREIEVLRESTRDAKGRLERLHSEGSGSTTDERLAELRRANESLSKDLEQKNEALQAVRSALESLKEEQSTIKETIVELRQENARLRMDGGDASSVQTPQTALVALPPPAQSPNSPKGILRRRLSPQLPDAASLHRLESRIKKVEKENKGLREANTTLSAKLFDEMEKTDALRVANEGLAARICKLVAFIQQNPSGAGAGEGAASSGNGGGSSKKAGGGSKRTKSAGPKGDKGRSRTGDKSRERRRSKSPGHSLRK